MPICRLGKNGEKILSKTSVTVLAEIKDEVYEIFNEIYNGPEKFPIKDINGEVMDYEVITVQVWL